MPHRYKHMIQPQITRCIGCSDGQRFAECHSGPKRKSWANDMLVFKPICFEPFFVAGSIHFYNIYTVAFLVVGVSVISLISGSQPEEGHEVLGVALVQRCSMHIGRVEDKLRVVAMIDYIPLLCIVYTYAHCYTHLFRTGTIANCSDSLIIQVLVKSLESLS